MGRVILHIRKIKVELFLKEGFKKSERMDDTGPKSQCVNCALLVDSVDVDSMELEKMASQLTTFLVPGVFFLGIALRCFIMFRTNIFLRKKPKSNSAQFTAHKVGEERN